jgi:hypothetical protein
VVETPKREVLEAAEVAGGSVGSLFLFIGSFAIIAGVLLLVNVFVMLAEERKGELGMLRAVGMRRGRLVRGFVVEGAVYSLVAAAVGLAAGLGVGRAVVAVTARIFAGFSPEEGGIDLVFTATPTSLVNGFAAGFLIGFVTVALTSIRISRVNIIAAIRDLPPSAGRRLRWRWVLASTLAAAGIGAAARVAVAGSQGVGTYLLPPLAVLALCPLLVRLLPRRAVYTGASLAVLGWGLAANTLRPKVFDDGSTATFIVIGVVLTFSAVLLVSQNQELLLRLARPLLARPSSSGLAARLAVAYPMARRFRTGATLIMYGLVVFTLVLISVLGSVIDASVDREVAAASGGYALRVDYNPSAPVADPEARLMGQPFAGRVTAVAPLASAEARVLGVPGATKPVRTTVVGATPALAAHGLFPLEERLGRLGGDDRSVWRAVLSDPGYVLLDQYLGQEGSGIGAVTYRPGDTLTVVDPASGRQARKVVAGILSDSTAFDRAGDGDFASPVVMASAGLREQFGRRARPAGALLAVAPDASDRDLAADLQGEFLPQGAVVTRIRHLVEQDFAANRSFFRLLQGFLALGLVVGVAGLGVVMVRAVRERRRTVGVLRALGLGRAAGVPARELVRGPGGHPPRHRPVAGHQLPAVPQRRRPPGGRHPVPHPLAVDLAAGRGHRGRLPGRHRLAGPPGGQDRPGRGPADRGLGPAVAARAGVAEHVLDLGDHLVVGEPAAVVEAGLDHGQDAVGQQGQLARLVEVDGGQGLRDLRPRLGRRLGGRRRRRRQLLAALAEGAQLTAPGREARLVDREGRGAGVLGHPEAGAVHPQGVGVGEHGHVDRLAGHVLDHRAVVTQQQLALGGRAHLGQPEVEGVDAGVPGDGGLLGLGPGRPGREPEGGDRLALTQPGRERRHLSRRGLGADLDHVHPLAGGDRGQGVGAGHPVGAVRRPEPGPGDHGRAARPQPGPEVVGVAEPGAGDPAGAAGAADEHGVEAEDGLRLAVPDPRGRPGKGQAGRHPSPPRGCASRSPHGKSAVSGPARRPARLAAFGQRLGP